MNGMEISYENSRNEALSVINRRYETYVSCMDDHYRYRCEDAIHLYYMAGLVNAAEYVHFIEKLKRESWSFPCFGFWNLVSTMKGEFLWTEQSIY